MFFNTFVSSATELQSAAQIENVNEVLLEPILLARQGQLTQPQLFELAQMAHPLGLRSVLVWDILMTDSALENIGDRLLNWDMTHFSAVRVADIGVAQWLKEHIPQVKIQLIAETGNHNLESLLGWCEHFGNHLDRLILSIELPAEKLTEYCHCLPIDCEILGAGRILLFYSPRNLLSVDMKPQFEGLLEAQIQTDEYGDRLFPTQESIHGTLMYLDKDQFLLDRLSDLEHCGFHTVRIDIRHFKNEQHQQLSLAKIIELAQNDGVALQGSWPFPVRAPFFKANRTTAVFPRLKSKLLPLRDTLCIAECIGSKNGEYGVFRTLQPFDRSQIKQMILPTKIAVDIPDTVTFQTVDGQPLGSCDANRTIIMSWIKRTASGSILMR